MKLKFDDETNSKLRPLYSLGIVLKKATGNQAKGDCPFCYRKEHFYVNRKTAQWDCKSCGKKGNMEQFLSEYARLNFTETEDTDYEPLAKATGLPKRVFRNWSVGWDGEYFLLHDRHSKKIVKNITRFDSRGKFKGPLWGLPVQLYGTYKAGAEGVRTVWIAEGHKDCWTLSWLLHNSSKEFAVGVPGAMTFKNDWIQLFEGRHVILCYDNDEQGKNGTRKAISLLSNVAESIKVLNWPESEKDGYDVTDYYKQLNKKRKSPNSILEKIGKLIKPWGEVTWVGEVKKASRSKAITVPATEIELKHMEYLWPDRIPLGCTTIYYGMPQQGKSSQALDVAARISTGAEWPSSKTKAPKGSTLLIAQEDDVRDVILWRYRAMGGDRSKLHIFKGIQKPNQDWLDWLDITKDLPAIEEEIKLIKRLKLIIIDPISAYFGKADTYKNSEVRATLGPLNILAQRYNIAILLIHHVNKNIQQNILHRMSGSTAFSESARQAWVFGASKEDSTRKLMVCAKKSYGAPITGFAFRFKQVSLADVNSIKLIYESTAIQESAQEIFSEMEKSPGRPAKAREQAEDFLKRKLADGSMPIATVKSLAENQGISTKTLYRARDNLKIQKFKPKTGPYKGMDCWKLSKIVIRCASKTKN